MPRLGEKVVATRNQSRGLVFRIQPKPRFPGSTRPGPTGFGRIAAHPEAINVTRSCLLDNKRDNMLEDYVSAKITQKRLKAGPAANHVDDFSDWLHARGPNKRSLFRMLQFFAGWTDWLTKTGRTAEDLAEGLQECTKHFRSAPHIPYERGPRRESLTVARFFPRFLGERGHLPQIAGAHSPACSAPLLREFYSWMLEQEGRDAGDVECLSQSAGAVHRNGW
jgi:hypothetical protein